MHGFESIIDQQLPVECLRAFLIREAVPHALLFTGADGVGKRTVALRFAKACNCLRFSQKQGESPGFCDECPSCRKIDSGNHPDIDILSPSGGANPMIKIDPIRQLCRKLTFKPYIAQRRVVIIVDAHTMNKEAGNALLKVLEEPPEATLIIITAHQTSDLLDTIVSRCRRIRFQPVSSGSIRGMLQEQYGVDLEKASVLAAIADGSFSRAASLAKTDWMLHREWVVSQLEQLKGRSTRFCMALAERLTARKGIVQDYLDIIKIWLRDLIIFKYNPDKVVNKDLVEKIGKNAANDTVEGILYKMKAVDQAMKEIRSNSNARLTMEVLMFRLAGLLAREGDDSPARN